MSNLRPSLELVVPIALIDLADLAGDEHVPLIIAALSDPLPTVRAEAAHALEAFETDDGIRGLIALLDDPDQAVRAAAAHGLHDLKLPSSVRLLLPHLQDASNFKSIALLRALRELRVPESFSPALSALDNTEPEVRREAIAVLGYLKHADALPALSALAANDADAEVRRAAISP